MKQDLDAQLPKLAEGLIAERVVARREVRTLEEIERNDNVIVRVSEALYLGEDAYLMFAIQNRDRSLYRLATVKVLADGQHHADGGPEGGGCAPAAEEALEPRAGPGDAAPARGRGGAEVLGERGAAVLRVGWGGEEAGRAAAACEAAAP